MPTDMKCLDGNARSGNGWISDEKINDLCELVFGED